MKIDRTYILSLPERYGDRLVPLISHLQILEINDYKIYTAIKNKNGALGLVQTIEQLFSESLVSGVDNILVFEDDIVFTKPHPKEIISQCLIQLPSNYDCLFLGCNLWQTVVYKYSPNLIQLYDAYGTQSVLYSRSAMQKIIKAIQEMKGVVPLDFLIKEKIMPDGNCYCSFPSITSQINSFSDIEGKYVDYTNLLETRFEEKTRHLKHG